MGVDIAAETNRAARLGVFPQKKNQNKQQLGVEKLQLSQRNAFI